MNDNLVGKKVKFKSLEDAQAYRDKHAVNKSLFELVGMNMFEICKTTADNTGKQAITAIKFNNKIFHADNGQSGHPQLLINSGEMKYFAFNSRAIDRMLLGEQIDNVRMINDNTVIIVRDNEIVNYVIPDELLEIMKSN